MSIFTERREYYTKVYFKFRPFIVQNNNWIELNYLKRFVLFCVL